MEVLNFVLVRVTKCCNTGLSFNNLDIKKLVGMATKF